MDGPKAQNRPAAGVSTPFEYVFPAIRGVQAGHEHFVSMCPLRLIPKIFVWDDPELRPELRAQRVLNKGRIPELARYIVENRGTYTFSAITASIDSEVRFEPFGSDGEARRVGLLHIPMSAKFVINDGQHRRAAIEQALKDSPELADESIAVVFFLDLGLKRCQQMFADLNRYAIRPATSLGLLYDHRDDRARISKQLVFELPLFKELTELERSTLSPRSRKLFTLSALHSATSALLAHMDEERPEELQKIAMAFWEEAAKQFPEWTQVQERKIVAGEVRRDLLHSHGIVLQALGRVGNTLLREQPTTWKKTLRKLAKIDWSRANSKLWEGRALIAGKVSKHSSNVTLVTNTLKGVLGLALTPDEQRVEDAFLRGDHVAD
jgi:DNA sulfur modification protein DndB